MMPGGRIAADDEPAMWATFLAELWHWVAEHGERVVPTTTVTVVNDQIFNLGSRVKNARVYYHRGSLTARQISQLEAIPAWSWNGHRANSRVTWQTHMSAVRVYVSERGSVAGLERADPPLAKWLQTQRRRSLTSSQRAELLAIPRALEEPTYFLDRFVAHISAWIEAVPGRDTSHLLRSTTINIDGQIVKIGERAADWRRRYQRGELTDGEAARLSALTGWSWEPRPPGRRPRALERLAKI